jgi:RNA polymerase sigma-70 factor (ECF subfamily)
VDVDTIGGASEVIRRVGLPAFADLRRGSARSLADERLRLIRLCAQLTGDAGAAEDLAQEALLVALREERRLRDPEVRRAWLAGIARNLCLHWIRSRRREAIRSVGERGPADRQDALAAEGDDDGVVDCFDLELEVERDELASLLERALSLLPAHGRAVLIEHYLLERPQAEIARRLGVSTAAVTMRLHRAKLALRDVLATDLRDEATSYGLIPRSVPSGQATRIWCPLCGNRRLVGTFVVVDPSRTTRRLSLSCPKCFAGSDLAFASSGGATMFGAVQGYRAALLRVLDWCRGRLLDLPAERRSVCARCGAAATTEVRADTHGQSPLRAVYRVFESCRACGQVNDVYLAGLAAATPDGRRFWRDHPRSVVVPERSIDAGGHAAVVTGLQAVGESARLEVVLSVDRLRVLGVHRT